MSADGQFARLSAVSKVLFDRELIELRREHDALKLRYQQLELKLFWELHSIEKLRAAIKQYGPRGWFLAYSRDDLVTCTLYPWFPTLAESCGLQLGESKSVDFEQQKSEATECHCVVRRGQGVVSYGAKLLNATSVSDPELQKLNVLFNVLYAAMRS